jgi:DNA end-binding protein Ku
MARQRSMWTGSLSFGLVNVPVSLVTATRDKDLHFHQIHGKTHERLSIAYVCTKENAPVDYSEIAHGFDTGEGYVMLTDEELAAAQPEKTRTIDISQFVDLAEIDPILFDHPYYLVPAGEGEGPLRAYRLLALTTMLFQHEVRPTDDLDLPKRRRPSKAKVDQAAALVEALAADFDHGAYKDRYREQLRKIVKAKEAGETIKAPRAAKAPDVPPDLMEILKASLDEVRAGSR